jgi:hypothetical protein
MAPFSWTMKHETNKHFAHNTSQQWKYFDSEISRYSINLGSWKLKLLIGCSFQDIG